MKAADTYAALKLYVPVSVRERISSGLVGAEFRRLAVMFIQLPALDFGDSETECVSAAAQRSLFSAQRAVRDVNEVVTAYSGAVRQVIMDDKGIERVGDLFLKFGTIKCDGSRGASLL